MPRKFLTIKDAIKDVPSPVMVFLSKGEVASQKTNLKAFTNGTLTLVSNIDKLFDPAEGGNLPMIEKSAQDIDSKTFQQFDSLITMNCNKCNAVAGVDPDLAFAIAGEDMHCPSCGKECAYLYNESETADETDPVTDEDVDAVDDSDTSDDSDDSEDSEDDEEEIDSVEDTDDSDETDDEDEDEDEDDSDDDTVVTDETAAEVVVEEPVAVVEKPVADAVVETVVDKTVTEAAAEEVIEGVQAVDAPEAVVEKEIVTDPAPVQEVHAMAMADENASVRLVTLSNDNSEIAAFVGSVHVGTLTRSMASETAAPLFADGKKLVSAFKPVFNANRKNQASTELAAYGFKPVTFKVSVGDLFAKRLEKETAAIKATADAEVASKVTNMNKLLELAFVGINKGFFEGKNDLANEVAALLSRNGVVNAAKEVRSVFAKHSHNYVKAGVEKASELASQSADYVRGVAESISKAEFTAKEEPEKASLSTSMIPTAPVRKAEVASDDFVGERRAPEANKFRSIISGIRNR